MSISFFKNITICILSINILTGCSTGVMGETVIGRAGSPAWFGSASQETVIDHYKKACKSYGYAEGSIEMADCVEKSIRTGKGQAEQRKMNSFKILGDMEKRERESYQSPQTGTVTCTQQGYFTKCKY
jgi:hypothetical protein